uniref:PPO candidate 1 n=1 Tax=uncultured Thiotrichaceae bacterium TaxID=298394 RepID=A0A6S6UKA8_9GAMM|nr:MAG: PPO candidate 1 [uncultured Thiotrichaceae bacterium]
MAHESTMLELGVDAPVFSLPEPATGKTISLDDYAGQPLLVAFICNHCPYVVHIRQAFMEMAKEYQQKGVAFVAINSNDVDNYPDDSPDKMIEEVKLAGYDFPYLFDETQAVAQSYKAACTPDFFLFDQQHKLFYRGQFDSSRPRNDDPVTGENMRAALDDLLKGSAPPSDQRASMGCNIKWKAGNQPEYFGTSV